MSSKATFYQFDPCQLNEKMLLWKIKDDVFICYQQVEVIKISIDESVDQYTIDGDYIDPKEDDVLKLFNKNKKNYNERFKAKRRKYALTEKQRNELVRLPRFGNKKLGIKKNTIHYMIMRLQLQCGLRVSEVVNILIPHFKSNEEEHYIEIRPYTYEDYVYKTKTPSSRRTIFLDDDLAFGLMSHVNRVKKEGFAEEGFLFYSQKDTRMSIRQVQRFVNRYANACKTIGRDIGTHIFRRTFASFLIKKGHNILEIRDALGHKNVKTTWQYLFELENIEAKIAVAKTTAEIQDTKSDRDLKRAMKLEAEKKLKARERKRRKIAKELKKQEKRKQLILSIIQTHIQRICTICGMRCILHFDRLHNSTRRQILCKYCTDPLFFPSQDEILRRNKISRDDFEKGYAQITKENIQND